MILMAKREQLLVEGQHGARILLLGLDVVGLVARGNRKPRLRGRESSVGSGGPLHGSALAIASLIFGPADASDRIFDVLFTLGIVVLHAKLFAVIHDGSAAKREIETRHQLGDIVVVLAVSVTVVRARLVMVAD